MVKVVVKLPFPSGDGFVQRDCCRATIFGFHCDMVVGLLVEAGKSNAVAGVRLQFERRLHGAVNFAAGSFVHVFERELAVNGVCGESRIGFRKMNVVGISRR